ncbi:MAG: hypothetical protein HY080_15205 [Gammaproteobacteria bacterium]|nr:hypothetical protein [Gammaproteobacteria bacterium]
MMQALLFCSALSLFVSSATAADNLANLSSADIEQRLPNEHPAAYYAYARQLWSTGMKDQAVFWFYAGQLRYRFHLLANPKLDKSGDPASFTALQSQMGDPINLYAGADPQKWMQQIDRVLAWDATTPNGFTSKIDHKKELEIVRAGLVAMRDYIDKHRDTLRAQRAQQGIGATGIADGVYVEERQEKMPADWPKLMQETIPEILAGSYEASTSALLGPIFFFKDQHKVLSAKSFELSAAGPGVLLVIAKKDGQELLRRTITVRQENGAVVFDENKTAEQAGLAEGGVKDTNYLRLNTAGELIIQRDSLTQGKYRNKGPVRLSYTFWNRAKRIPTK